MVAFAASTFLVIREEHQRSIVCRRGRLRHSVQWPAACASPLDWNALVETLRKGSQPQKVLTLISLVRLPQGQALSAMRASGVLLDTSNRQVRITALATLGKIGVQDEASTLVSVMLNDDDHSVRAAAANGLGHLFPEKTTHQSDLKEMALEALAQAATQDEHFIVRYAAIVSLGNLADPSSVEILFPIATSISAPALEAAAAVTALGEVVTEEDVDDTLLRAVRARADDREDFVRAAVARTLGRWGNAGDARSSLLRMRENEEKYGQSELVRAILNDVFGSGDL